MVKFVTVPEKCYAISDSDRPGDPIFYAPHCNLQTLHFCVRSRLALAGCHHGSISNGAQMISLDACSIPLVPHQALHESTHWFC